MPAPRGFEALSVGPTRRIVDAAMRRDKRPARADPNPTGTMRGPAFRRWTSLPGTECARWPQGRCAHWHRRWDRGRGGGSCESSEFLSREMSWIEGIVGDDGGMVLVWQLGVKATL